MFKHSIVRHTGQWWKLLVGVVAVLFGSMVPFVAASGVSWTEGTLIAVAGYGFSLASIRCPACEQRWFWKALMYSEMYRPLMTEPNCPSCGYPQNSDKESASS